MDVESAGTSEGKQLIMSDNTSNSVLDSSTSPNQHKQANIPTLTSVIEDLQTIQTFHESQHHQPRAREKDFYRFLDDETTLRKAQDSTDRAYGDRIAQLRAVITTKDARIKELETQLNSHQSPAHDGTPEKQANTRAESEAPTVASDSTEKYCYCLRPSHGAMVACDNPSCPRQWFHLHHTNLPYLPFEDEDWTWICTLCRGWEALKDGGCWRCPKCFFEILDENEDYDEGVSARYTPRGCEHCGLEWGDAWQVDGFESAGEDGGEDEDGDEEGEGEGEGEGEADDGDDGIERDVDPEDAEMYYDDDDMAGFIVDTEDEEDSEGSDGVEEEDDDGDSSSST